MRPRRSVVAVAVAAVVVLGSIAVLLTSGDAGEATVPSPGATALTRAAGSDAAPHDATVETDAPTVEDPLVAAADAARPMWTAADRIGAVVIDADCEPVSGARVDVWAIPKDRWLPIPEGPPLTSLVTDATGHCGEPLQGELFVLVAQDAEGRASGRGGGKRADAVDLGDGRRGFVIELRRPTHITGRVLDADGRPAAGVTVHMATSQGREEEDKSAERGTVEVDSQGRFQLDPASGVEARLWASRADEKTPPEWIRLQPDAKHDVTLRFGGGAWIDGFAVGPDGAPAAGVIVLFVGDEMFDRVSRAIPGSLKPATAPVDANGGFRIDLDRPAFGMLTGMATGRTKLFADPVAVTADAFSSHERLTVRFLEPMEIDGHVFGPTRDPLRGALEARARKSADEPRPGWGPIAQALCGKARSGIAVDGRFVLRDVHPSATFDLLYEPAPLGSRPVLVAEDVRPGTRGLQLTVDFDDPPTGVLGGLVLARDKQRAIRDFTITVLAHGPASKGVARQWSPDGAGLVPGQFRIEGLSRTVDYLLKVSASGYATDYHWHSAVEENEELMVWLEPRGQLEIFVRQETSPDDEWKPVPWAEVRIEPISDYPDLERVADLWHWRGRADGAGRVVIPAMDAGRWRVHATRGSQTRESPLTVKAGQDKITHVVLRR